jgi:hypothetical protein
MRASVVWMLQGVKADHDIRPRVKAVASYGIAGAGAAAADVPEPLASAAHREHDSAAVSSRPC